MKVTISDEVKDILKQGSCEGPLFFLPGIQLDRPTYIEVNNVLAALEGKWNRSQKAHVFPSDAETCIDKALSETTLTDRKTELQFFETPAQIAKEVIALADIRDGMTVLEPSAGQGALLDQIYGSPDIGLICIELDERNCDVLKSKGYAAICDDFLKFGPDACDVDKDPHEVTDQDIKYCLGDFDRIIMNPPFTKQQDIDHVQHAYSLLNEGGRLVAIMSSGFTFRTNKKSVAFKELVDAYGYWSKLPADSFKQSGTSVHTVIVVLDKPVIN